MVSFSCENCGDVLTKKKLDPHRNQCRGASFTCLDCMVHFYGTEYRSHTSCISEAQKYQGALYRDKEKGKKSGDGKRKSMQGASSQAMVPRGAYVEDAPEDGEASHAVAVVDVPPRAPTPPPAAEALTDGAEGVNVFDFLVSEATPNAKPSVGLGTPDERKMLESNGSLNGNGYGHDSQYSQYSNGTGERYQQHGFSYGDAPVEPSFERYDSWHKLPNPDSQSQSQTMPGSFVQTPAPKGEKRSRRDKDSKSDKKRKRQHVDELDLSATKRPSSRGDEQMLDAPSTVSRTLHSGLTGGLSKLVTDPDFYSDRIDAGPTPISPLKRSKRDHKDKVASKEDHRKSSYTSHSTAGRTISLTSKPDDKKRDRDQRTYHDDKHRSSRRQPSPSSSPEPHTHSKPRPKALEYPPPRPSSVQPTSSNALAPRYNSKAQLFLSFVNKGPESERGVSVNKALKRYHREVGERAPGDKEEGDKELWKGLRVRRNERGEFVLFLGDE